MSAKKEEDVVQVEVGCFPFCNHGENGGHDDRDGGKNFRIRDVGEKKEPETLGAEKRTMFAPLGSVENKVKMCGRCGALTCYWILRGEDIFSALALKFGFVSISITSEDSLCQRCGI